jgi:hypothetical protein
MMDLFGSDLSRFQHCDQFFPFALGDVFRAMLDAPSRDLAINGVVDFALRFPHLRRDFFTTTHDVQRGPRKQRSHWTEIRAVSFAAHPCRFEWNRPAAAESVPDSRHMSEAVHAQFAHKVG